MCRWAAYIGAPIFMSDILSAPAHSLVDQSRSAEKGKTELNADGFGVAWYGIKPSPAVFKDVQPAWSNENLKSLVENVQTALFLSHVRASTGSGVSRSNCHPFVVENWSFMHNGLIGDYNLFRQKSDMMIQSDLYHYRQGSTDSEAFFLISMGFGLALNPIAAVHKTIEVFRGMCEEGIHLRLSIAMSDGQHIFTVRYASDHQPPTIFFRPIAFGTGWSIVSEPFGEDHSDWSMVPNNSFCTFSSQSAPKIEKLYH